MRRWRQADLEQARAASGRPYHEFLRRAQMSGGLYVLPAGGIDRQQPHTEDEVYVVIRGRSRFTAGGETIEVAPGDVIFVPAGEDHRFHDVVDELALTVVFAPAERSRSTGSA